MRFKSSMDGLAIGITIAVSGLFGYTLYMVATHVAAGQHSGGELAFLVLVIMLAYFIAYGFNSGEYIVRDGELVLWRPIAPIHIPLSDIVSKQPIDPASSGWLIRVAGVGGLFGYFGKFWNRELGIVTVYGRRRSNRILLDTVTRGRIVIAPDDPNMIIYL